MSGSYCRLEVSAVIAGNSASSMDDDMEEQANRGREKTISSSPLNSALYNYTVDIQCKLEDGTFLNSRANILFHLLLRS